MNICSLYLHFFNNILLYRIDLLLTIKNRRELRQEEIKQVLEA